jgi:hypothetical protein
MQLLGDSASQEVLVNITPNITISPESIKRKSLYTSIYIPTFILGQKYKTTLNAKATLYNKEL